MNEDTGNDVDDDDDYSRGGGSDDAWNDGMRICEKALASKRLLLLLLLLDGEKNKRKNLILGVLCFYLYTSSCVSIFFMLFEKLLYVTKELWYSIDFPIFIASYVSLSSPPFVRLIVINLLSVHEWDLGFDFDKLFLL